MDRSLLATGFGYSAQRRALQASIVAALLPQIRDIRRIGSAALNLCEVAGGRLDAFWEEGVNHWDVAAGGLIAMEAGAVMSTSGLTDAKTGWLIDFAELRRAVDPLVAQLDHYLLNEIEGLENPTSERVAVWIWERLAPQLAQLHGFVPLFWPVGSPSELSQWHDGPAPGQPGPGRQLVDRSRSRI